ncbi:MAG: DNA recombination protein RmuC [Deltaproteobacteria bacterium]
MEINLAIVFILGFTAGSLVSIFIMNFFSQRSEKIANELIEKSQQQHKESVNEMAERMRASFGTLSLEALSKSTDQFLKLAKISFEQERSVTGSELEGKKALIDGQLKRIMEEMETVRKFTQDAEKDRMEKYGEITKQIKITGETIGSLTQTTGALKEVLASSKARGQWGERMAEDVLHMAGFVEGINYQKQKKLAHSDTIPDFTFILPRDLSLNMDVKFPLDNYLRFIEAEATTDKEMYRSNFMKDVKDKIKEVATRGYISPADGTVDCALCFIPNEQVLSFIHEYDNNNTINNEAIKRKIVICSPVTIFAVLALIRQATENFALEKTSNKILSLLGDFRKQWDGFCEGMDKVGKRIEDAHKEYDALSTTRRRALEKPLNKIDDIRKQEGIPIADSSIDGL